MSVQAPEVKSAPTQPPRDVEGRRGAIGKRRNLWLSVGVAFVLGVLVGYLLRWGTEPTKTVTKTVGPAPAVVPAVMTWDGTTCGYAGPDTLVRGQSLRIDFQDQSQSEAVALVFGGFPADADYNQFVAWASTHAPNFFGTFPPSRFVVPGIGKIVVSGDLRDGAATTKPFGSAGSYYIACLAFPADALGSTIHLAGMVDVVKAAG